MNDIHGYVGAYVADALELELRIVFTEHLQDCESCGREVREFTETLALVSVGSAAPPPGSLRAEVLDAVSRIRIDPPDDPTRHSRLGPPDSLRDDVLRAVHRMPAGQRGHDHPIDSWSWDVSAPASSPGPRRRPDRWLSLAIAASVIMVMMIGGWALIQQRRLDQLERAQGSAQPTAELLRAPDLRTHPVTWPDGTRGSFLVSRQLNRVLLTGAVPALAPGRTYQLWSIRGAERRPGPTFRPDTVAVWDVDLAGVREIAITAEPEGGSTRPAAGAWGTAI